MESQAEAAGAQVSEAQIAVHWREEEYYDPPPRIREVANANDPAILERFSEEHFPDCFVEYAELLTWDRKWDTILDTSKPPFFKWWVGGKLNASVNCIDRHLDTRATGTRSSGYPSSRRRPPRRSPTATCTGA